MRAAFIRDGDATFFSVADVRADRHAKAQVYGNEIVLCLGDARRHAVELRLSVAELAKLERVVSAVRMKLQHEVGGGDD